MTQFTEKRLKFAHFWACLIILAARMTVGHSCKGLADRPTRAGAVPFTGDQSPSRPPAGTTAEVTKGDRTPAGVKRWYITGFANCKGQRL